MSELSSQSSSARRPPRISRLAGALRASLAPVLAARPLLTVFLAGAVSVVALAPFHAWPVLMLTVPVLFWALEEASAAPALGDRIAQGFRRGWAFGMGFHLAGLFWVGSAFLVQPERFALIMPFAVAGLAAGLAVFHGLAGGVASALFQRASAPMPRLAALALALMASEWLRGHILTGFPWNTLGQALTMPLPLMQAVGVIGIYGLTAATVVVLAAPLVAAAAPAPRVHLTIALATLLPLALAAGYGWARLEATPTRYTPDVRLRVVQPSISQRDKFDDTKRRSIFERHLELTRTPPRAGPGATEPPEPPTLVIWPEAAIPFFVRRVPEAPPAIAAALPDGAALIAGTFRLDADPGTPDEQIKAYRIYNIAVAYGDDGRLLALYDKLHLVPFGEYLPAARLLNALGLENLTRTRGGMASGRGPRKLIELPGLPPLEILICYEAIFPEEVATGATRPGALINVTNDAWFGLTTGPYQHFHQSRLRAVEQGIPMVRSANNGISAIVDPVGRVTASLPLNAVGVVDHGLPRPAPPPPYAYLRGWSDFITAIFMLGWFLIGHNRRTLQPLV